jgi:FemAB-related protein (PEP-CTERM system-associated)
VEIKFYTDDVRKMWDDYVYTHPQGTFFHLIGWKRVIENTFGYQPWYVYAEDHGAITGVLPLFAVKKPVFGVRLVSVPFGVYGGLCAHDAGVETLLLERAKQLTQEIGADCLELRHAVANGHELPVKSLYVTFQRTLYADEEENLQAIPRKQRRMVRQGAKHDLHTKMGDDEDLQGFYDVYAQSLHNLGTPAFPRRYFHALREEFGEQCRILSVWHHHTMVAAVMTFFFKDWVMPYYGGALKDYFRYAVNDFMYWELMCYASRSGFNVFDFGRSREDSGSYAFKKHWGFEPQPLPYQYYLPKGGSLPNLSPANPKFRVLIAAWKRLPFSVTKILGPQIIRYLP